MKRIIIITGASSGIGQEFARQILDFRQADELWLVARREERLRELAAELEASWGKSIPAGRGKNLPGSGPLSRPSVRIIVQDISGRLGYRLFSQLFAEEAQRGEFTIDTLVNNAGFGTYGPFADTPPEREMEMVELNATSVTGTCGAALPYMSRGSSIINVASLAAYIPLGNFAVYAASKSYVRSFSLALAAELKDRGIHVLALCPGSVATEFARVASNGAREEVLRGKPVDKVVRHALICQKKKRKIALWALKWKLNAFMSRFVGHYRFARHTYLHEKRPYRPE